MKRLLAVCLVVAMAIGLCACGGSKKMTPEEVMKATSENMSKMESTGFTMTEEIGMKVDGMDMTVKVNAEGEIIAKPMAMHMKLDVDAAMLAMKMEMYMQTEGDKANTYVGIDMGSGVQWGKETGDAVEMPEMPVDSALEMLKYYENLKEVGTEKINGVNTVRYDAEITGKNLKDLMKAMSEMTGDMAGDMDAMFEMLGDDASTPISFFIDTKNMVLVEGRMDMTELFSSFMDSAAAGGEVSKITFSMGYHDFNKIDKIEIPEEALNAPDM